MDPLEGGAMHEPCWAYRANTNRTSGLYTDMRCLRLRERTSAPRLIIKAPIELDVFVFAPAAWQSQPPSSAGLPPPPPPALALPPPLPPPLPPSPPPPLPLLLLLELALPWQLGIGSKKQPVFGS